MLLGRGTRRRGGGADNAGSSRAGSSSGGEGVLFLKVHVVPNARQASVVRMDDATFEVRVDERAERGRANRRLLELMSEHLGVPRSKLALVRGATSRDKTVMLAP